MVVKYLDMGTWGYIDHIRQATSKMYDGAECVKAYEEALKEGDTDYASFMDGKPLPAGVVISNKIFMHIADTFEDLSCENLHTENMVLIKEPEEDIQMPIYAVLLYVEDCKEFDAIILVTNQKCYLMNDEGKTIERLS